MICRRTESNDILLELVAKTLAVGAYEMQVEYEDRKEHVLAFQKGLALAICERCRLAGSSCKLAPPAEHRWGVYSPGNDLVSQFPINRMALEIFAGPHDPALHMPGRSLVAVSRR